MRLIVASDLTALSDRALQRGFQLADELAVELVVRHVVDEALPAEQRNHSLRWAQETLAQAVAGLLPPGQRKPQFEIVVGDPKAAIVSDARPNDAIILGIHSGPAERGKRFADSTAGRALMSTFGAVLLVREPVLGPYDEVVIGIDFTDYSRAALQQAAVIAPTARIQLVHAYQVPFQGLMGSRSFAGSVALAEHSQLDAFLIDAIEEVGVDSAMVDVAMREGEPASVLRRACEECSAALIVIGTHGRRGLSRTIWGSVAADLLEMPPCDVLVIKQDDR